jgi:predicted HD superfamily hydrolase involved in NAD metabolism
MNCTINDIKEWLRANLTEERYEHSLGTADCAKMLAEKFGLDSEKAYFTGLIHDCAKCLPEKDMQEALSQCELVCGEADNKKTHHAPAGVIVAKKEFGVIDEEILSAIRWHTIGKLNMTLFEKIIFLADKIETRTRPVEYREPITVLLEEENGLDKALLMCYECTIKSLVDRKLTICTATVDIYNELLNSLKV